jgi:hypothetical protein
LPAPRKFKHAPIGLPIRCALARCCKGLSCLRQTAGFHPRNPEVDHGSRYSAAQWGDLLFCCVQTPLSLKEYRLMSAQDVQAPRRRRSRYPEFSNYNSWLADLLYKIVHCVPCEFVLRIKNDIGDGVTLQPADERMNICSHILIPDTKRKRIWFCGIVNMCLNALLRICYGRSSNLRMRTNSMVRFCGGRVLPCLTPALEQKRKKYKKDAGSTPNQCKAHFFFLQQYRCLGMLPFQ